MSGVAQTHPASSVHTPMWLPSISLRLKMLNTEFISNRNVQLIDNEYFCFNDSINTQLKRFGKGLVHNLKYVLNYNNILCLNIIK